MAIKIINGINSSNNSFKLSLFTYNLLIDKNETIIVTVTMPSDEYIYVTSSNFTVTNVSITCNYITINTLAYSL